MHLLVGHISVYQLDIDSTMHYRVKMNEYPTIRDDTQMKGITKLFIMHAVMCRDD